MARFFFHHVSLHRSQIMVRRLRVRLARKRGVNTRLRRTLAALQVAAADFEERNREIRDANEFLFVFNTLADQWIHDRLVELEDDP